MRILALSDIHSNEENLEKILAKIDKKSFDLIVISGDITNAGTKKDCERILNKLRFAKIVAIAGNLDSKEVFELLEEKRLSIHGKRIIFKGYNLVGFGGGIIGNVGEVLFKEKELFDALKDIVDKNTILISHMPPKDTAVDNANGIHIGSNALKEIIERNNPLLCLCGHAHEAITEQKIGNTLCVNVGPVKNGYCTIVNINKEDVRIERIKL